jgi:hypothetical protein
MGRNHRGVARLTENAKPIYSFQEKESSPRRDEEDEGNPDRRGIGIPLLFFPGSIHALVGDREFHRIDWIFRMDRMRKRVKQ